jgi:hypothetical protein
MSKKKKIKKKKYYHASPVIFSPGDFLLHTIQDRNYNASTWYGDAIFMTWTPVPHYTILEKALAENWEVYEVEPLKKVYKGTWDDFYTQGQVRVIKRVGSCRGISKNGVLSSSVSWSYKNQSGKLKVWKKKSEAENDL